MFGLKRNDRGQLCKPVTTGNIIERYPLDESLTAVFVAFTHASSIFRTATGNVYYCGLNPISAVGNSSTPVEITDLPCTIDKLEDI